MPFLSVGRERLPFRDWNCRINPEFEDCLAFVERRQGPDGPRVRSQTASVKICSRVAAGDVNLHSTSLAKVSRDWRPTQRRGIIISCEIILARDVDFLCLNGQVGSVETSSDFSAIGAMAEMATAL